MSLPPEAQYSFDCICFEGRVLADTTLWFNSFYEGATEWYDALEWTYPQSFRTFPKKAEDKYHQWFMDTGTDHVSIKSFLCVEALRSVNHQVNEISYNCLSSLVQEAERRSLGPTSAHKFFHSPKVQMRHIKRSCVVQGYVKLLRRHIDRFSILVANLTSEQVINNHGEEMDKARIRMEEAHPMIFRKKAKPDKAARNAMRKSLKVLEEFTGKETAKAYIKGDQIEIEGRKFNFLMKKNQILSRGHSSNKITVTDKDGVVITDLCFYFEDTPAPEQVVAMMLHVMAGDEDEILQIGNFYNIRNADRLGKEHYVKEVELGDLRFFKGKYDNLELQIQHEVCRKTLDYVMTRCYRGEFRKASRAFIYSDP